MPKQFLQITFKFADGRPKTAKLKPVFDHALDWFKYASNCWIVWTSASAEKWYARLRPHITDDDSLFIVRIDPEERQGWMSKTFWDWLNEHGEEAQEDPEHTG